MKKFNTRSTKYTNQLKEKTEMIDDDFDNKMREINELIPYTSTLQKHDKVVWAEGYRARVIEEQQTLEVEYNRGWNDALDKLISLVHSGCDPVAIRNLKK
jgi:hypothetical protein